MWEDARNHNGGRWLISLDKKQRVSELDNYWLEVVCNKLKTHSPISSNIISLLLVDIMLNW